MCYDKSELLLLHNIFMLKEHSFLQLKTLVVTKSLSIQANKKCTYAVSQKESDLSY